jgi:hypothetical protein
MKTFNFGGNPFARRIPIPVTYVKQDVEKQTVSGNETLSERQAETYCVWRIRLLGFVLEKLVALNRRFKEIKPYAPLYLPGEEGYPSIARM